MTAYYIFLFIFERYSDYINVLVAVVLINQFLYCFFLSFQFFGRIFIRKDSCCSELCKFSMCGVGKVNEIGVKSEIGN